MTDYTLRADVDDDGVATVEFGRGRNNFFDHQLIAALADELERLAADVRTRAVLLCSTGKHFCAGADFSQDSDPIEATDEAGEHLYDSAVRLFAQPLPIVAAVQGAAVGGGLGLAMACDMRFASPESRFAAPFARLGLHHGFGLSVTLPLVLGHQRALDLLYTGRRVGGEEALRLGLCDGLASAAELRETARAYAAQVAATAPIALRSIRKTMRGDLAERVRAATEHEKAEQAAHRQTADHAEGVAADRDRRRPRFLGR